MPAFRAQAKISFLYVLVYGPYVLIKRPGLRLVFALTDSPHPRSVTPPPRHRPLTRRGDASSRKRRPADACHPVILRYYWARLRLGKVWLQSGKRADSSRDATVGRMLVAFLLLKPAGEVD